MRAEPGMLSGSSLLDPDIHADRFAFYSRLREEAPIYYDPKLGMYLASRFDDIQMILRDTESFSMEKGYREQYAKGFKEEWREILNREGGGFFVDHIMSDPPTHTRVRKLLENAFTARRVKELESRIRIIVAEVLERVADRGEVEAMRDIAVPITAQIICEQLGFDRKSFDPIRVERWSAAINAQIGRMQSHEQMLANAAAICDLQNVIIEHVRARQAQPQADMISDFVTARINDVESPELSFEEIVSSVRAMVAAASIAASGPRSRAWS